MKKNFYILFLATIFIGCKKESETLETAAISDYAPLVVGKYITYKLDSLVYTNFNSTATTRSYQVKYSVDAAITDNNNKPAFRIGRYIRNSSSGSFTPDATFMAQHINNSLEFVENNLRFIKLKLPIRDGYSWKGNSYIDTYSINSPYRYLDGWDYTYDSVGIKVNNLMTLTVHQQDEVINNPNDANVYHEINKGVEKYALGIGMIYKQFRHTEYQPAVPGRNAYYTGYGVTLDMIDHN